MTRRRIAFLFLALAALLALAVLFRAWWLPGLLSTLTDNAALIATLNNAVGVLGGLAAVVAALAAVLALRRPAAPTTDPVALVQPVALESLQATFRDVKGQAFQYIDRGATRPTALLAARRVVIVGPQKVGKSREAVELIGRALEYCHIPPARIFRPTNNLRALPPDAVAGQIAKDVTNDDALLLFIDDLPYAFRGDEFEQLSAALRALERGQALYVVATAREDQLDERGRAWLAAQRFETISLGRWSKEQIAGLVDDGIYLIETPVDTDGRAALIEDNDGTTEIARLTLLGVADKGQGDRKTIESIQKDTLVLTWQARRRALIEEQPAIEPLLRATAMFHMAHVPLYTDLVLTLAAGGTMAIWRWPALLTAMNRLMTAEALVQKEDGLSLQDYAAEGEGIEQETARQELGAFLMSSWRWLRFPGLRWLYLARTWHALALHSLAMDAQESDRPDLAISYYTAAIGWHPFFGYYNNRGLLHADKGSMDAALTDYDAAIRLDPNDAMAYYNLGLLYDNTGNPEAALAAFDAAIRFDPYLAPAYNNRGALHADAGCSDAALTNFDEAIRLDPNYISAYYNRGQCYTDIGRLDEALADYSEAIRLDPSHATAYYNRGFLHASAGRLDAALADYDEAIRLNPGESTAYYSRAFLHADAGRPGAAVADYDETIRLDPGNAKAYNNRGLLHADASRTDAALADYNEAIRLDPYLVRAYSNRGDLHASSDRLDAALTDVEEAIRLDPDDANTYYIRARLHAAAGRLDATLADFDQIIRLIPEDAEAYNIRGLIHGEASRMNAALADFDTAIRLNPTDESFFFDRGVLLRVMNKPQEATDDLEQAARLGRDTISLHMNLSGCYRDLGRADAAARHVALARERLTDDDLYNRACLEAIAGNDDLALDLLAQALVEGKADPASVRRDPDWRPLRDDPRFQALVEDK